MKIPEVRITFKQKLLIFTAILFFIVAAVQLLITTNLTQSVVMDKSQDYFKEVIKQIGIRIDTEIALRNQYIGQIVGNPSITYYLGDIQRGQKSRNYVDPQVKAEVLRLKPGRFYDIHDLYIFPYTGYPINCFYSEALEETDPYSRLILSRMQSAPSDKIIWDDVYGEAQRISSYAPIFDGKKVMGLVRTRFDKSFLGQVVDDVALAEDNIILIMDEPGTVVYASDSSLTGLNLRQVDTSGYYIVTSELKSDGWTVSGLIPHRSVSDQIRQINTVFIALYSLVFGVFLSVLIAYVGRLLRPMNNIVAGMRQLGEGKLDVCIQSDSRDELAFITVSFNHMVTRIRQLMNEVCHYQKTSHQAEMAALKSKINPHFLYNTLDTIYWMLVVKDDLNEADMVIKLSNILRYSISNDSEFAFLGEDMEQLESYIALQQYRFQDKLAYSLSIEDSLRDIKMPKMLLQPLVENALKHGFRDMEYTGLLEITAKSGAGCIELCVRDNGAGIPPEKLPYIFTSGIGLKITRDRVNFIYGEGYGVQVESEPGLGTEITVTIARHPGMHFSEWFKPEPWELEVPSK